MHETMKMIRQLLPIILLMAGLQASAQFSKPHFISVNVGANVPLAEFSEADSVEAGIARSGVYYSFEAGVYLSRNFGLGMNLGTFNNQVDEDRLLDEVREEFGNNGSFVLNTSEWTNTYVMVGPYLTIPLKKVILDFKFLGGAMSTEEPLVEITVDQNGQSTVQRNNEASGLAVGFNYGAHIRLQLLSKLGLRLNFEGFNSFPELKSKFETITQGTQTERENTYNQAINAMNLGVGLVVTL